MSASLGRSPGPRRLKWAVASVALPPAVAGPAWAVIGQGRIAPRAPARSPWDAGEPGSLPAPFGGGQMPCKVPGATGEPAPVPCELWAFPPSSRIPDPVASFIPGRAPARPAAASPLPAPHPPGGYENVAFAESLPAVATIVYVPFSSPSGTHHSDG